MPAPDPISAVPQPHSNTCEDDSSFVLPMSFGQEQLWLIDQMAPGNTAYNVLTPLRIHGHLDVRALERTLNEIVRRHEVLRATFDLVDTGPVQVISETASIPFILVDLCDVPDSSREAELLKRLSEVGTLPFDLKHGPLCRAHLFRLGPEHHVLLWNMHHIVSDGWSYTVLTTEIGSILSAFLRGEPCPLPELPIQYADFAQWQRDQFTPGRIEAEAVWWKCRLQGAPAVLDLPTDRPFGPTPSYDGRMRTLHFKPGIIERLLSIARESDTTLFTATFAAFFVLMYRYTGQSDLVLGTPTANRTRAELEQLIGYFVNTLPIRLQLRETMSFRDVVAEMRPVLYEAYEHQELPFERLVANLMADRTTNRNPIFQVTFQCHKAFIELPQVPGLEFSHIHIDRHGAPVDLGLAMIQRDGHWRVSAEYSTEVFDAPTIDRILGHYQTLLEGIAANPDQRLSDLSLLTSAERHQLLVEWNPDHAEHCLDGCIHQLFEKQVERSPDAVAAVFEREKVTYRELNQRSNQLAHALKRMGVGPETLVGVYMERSLEVAIGILGILKAGGAYLPLDPVYPQERLAFMLGDARPKAVLTQQRLLDSLPRDSGTILPLDADRERLGSESVANLDSGVGLDHLAYVIYTSGSTGKPKGTLVTHRNVARLFQATQAWFRFGAEDVWTLFHSHAFDFSVWELWGALAYGGRLVVVPYWVSRSPDAFYELLSNEGVTVLNQTPSAFLQLIQAEQVAREPLRMGLRLVILGGEALEMQSLKPWFDRHGDDCPRLVNMYGITETTVHVTYRPLTSADLKSGSVIGIPIPDLRVYILDRSRQLAPIGVPGELYVGGAGVARGYLNRPELTAEKFLVNPFTTKQGDRLYRSGDLARYLPNRDLEYLGRIDDQVKIRGFRIELGEIESVLAGHPGVREAVVAVREDVSGDKRLVAYLTAKEGEPPNVSELRGLLQAKLPEYMVPSAFVILERFPLTPNGKVDRKALPRPDLQSEPCGFVPPRSATEKALANIWGEVLGIEQVGLHDNFFELGGHSLLATRAASRASAAFLVDLPLRTLFEHPTLAGLAGQIDTLLWVRGQNHEAAPGSTAVLVEGNI